MALYINGQRYRVYIGSNKIAYDLKLAGASIITGPVLLSSDGYALRDINGVYLLPAEQSTTGYILSSDNYMLADKNGIYIVPSDFYNETYVVSKDNYRLQDKAGKYLLSK